MKRMIQIMIILVFVLNAVCALAAEDMRQLIRQGMKEIGAEKGHSDLCVLTDASYVKLQGKTTEGYLDMIREETGCSIGKGDLLLFQRPVYHPLVIALHREDSGAAVVITQKGEKAERVQFNIKGDSAADPERYGAIKKMLKGDTFSIVTILSSHTRGAPYDFLKCCQYHNHYCPGVTSGYFIARLIQEKYPTGPGEQYVWFACPPWCKDDAVSTVLDLTPGKRSIYIKELAEGQPAEGEKGRWAGIMVVWNAKAKKGKAIAFQFDWNKVYKAGGITAADFSPKGGKSNPAFFTARIRCSWAMIPHLDRPEMFVTAAREVEISPDMLKRMKRAGENPYEVIGLTK